MYDGINHFVLGLPWINVNIAHTLPTITKRGFAAGGMGRFGFA
jgi:hypothetical protein